MSLTLESMLNYNMDPWSLPALAGPGPRADDEDGSSLEGDVASNASGDSTHFLGVSASSGGEEIQSPPPRAGATCRPSSSQLQTLDKLADSTSADGARKKPAHSYIKLISQAILDSPDKRLLLGDIYAYIAEHFPYYRHTEDKAWKNSVRHNLSLNECFIKNGRSDNGKGNFWSIHPACVEDFKRGDFRRRQARRRAKRCHQQQTSTAPPTYQLPYPYSLGYGGQTPCGYQQPGYGLRQAYHQHHQPQQQHLSPPAHQSGLLMTSSPNSMVSPGISPMTSPTSSVSSYSNGYPTPTSLQSYAGYLQARKTATAAPPNVNSAQLSQLPAVYQPPQLYPTASQLYPSMPQLPTNRDYSQLFGNYYSPC